MHTLVGSDSIWDALDAFQRDEENEENFRFVGLKSTEILRLAEELKGAHSDELDSERFQATMHLCFQSFCVDPAKAYGDRNTPNFRRTTMADVIPTMMSTYSESSLRSFVNKCNDVMKDVIENQDAYVGVDSIEDLDAMGAKDLPTYMTGAKLNVFVRRMKEGKVIRLGIAGSGS
eukprot:gene22297-29374_t